jgi:nickel-dependent lactate racemase
MIDALSTVEKEVFAISTVLDKEHRVYACVAGDIHQSFEQATHLANEVFAAPLEEKADIVISVVKAPGDIDLYQSQKGIDNAKHAVADGGILILLSKCREGAGSETFIKLMSAADSPRDALRRIDEGYVLGYHKAAKLAEISSYAQMWAVTSMDPQVMSDIFIRPFDHIQDAVDAALGEKGRDAGVLILMDGGLTVPLVEPAT